MARTITMYKSKGTSVGPAKMVAPQGKGPSLSQTMPASGGIVRGAGNSPTPKKIGRQGLSSYSGQGTIHR